MSKPSRNVSFKHQCPRHHLSPKKRVGRPTIGENDRTKGKPVGAQRAVFIVRFQFQPVRMDQVVRRTKSVSGSGAKPAKPKHRSRSSSPRKTPRSRNSNDLFLLGDAIFPTPNRSRSGTWTVRRVPTAAERERQERIDMENRILLRKILEQHHGIRRQSAIPSARSTRTSGDTQEDIRLRLAKNKRTSNQINKQRLKHKTDYENLLLLQKIQNVRPSREIVDSFRSLSLQR